MRAEKQLSVLNVIAALLVGLGGLGIAKPAHGANDLRRAAAAAVSQDPDQAQRAISELRAAGPDGLAALFDANIEVIHRHAAAGELDAPDDAGWKRLSAALDAVAAQRDAYTSDLYWYTDLEKAKAAAK